MPKPSNEIELMVDSLTQHLVNEVQALPEAPVPYRSVKLSGQEQMREYTLMRNDVGVWRQRVHEHGWAKVIKYGLTMEPRLQKALGSEEHASTE